MLRYLYRYQYQDAQKGSYTLRYKKYIKIFFKEIT